MNLWHYHKSLVIHRSMGKPEEYHAKPDKKDKYP